MTQSHPDSPSSAASSDAMPGHVLASRGYRLYLVMRLAGIVALQIQSVAVGWQIYAITHRALDLGLAGLAQFVPVFGLVLVSGQVADRYDRRLVLAACLGMQFLCSILLLIIALGPQTTVVPIYGVLLFYGVARAFMAPASQSLLPNLVPKSQLGKAFAINSSVMQAATIGGPALGGVLFAVAPSLVYAVCGAMTFIAAMAALGIRVPPRTGDRKAVTWDSVVAGIRFIRGEPAILGAISLDLFAVLFGGATALLPVYARDILAVGPMGLGLLRTAPAVGAMAVGLALAQRSLGGKTGRTMFVMVALFGLATVVFGLSTNFYLSLACLAVLGGADMISVFVRQNLVQRRTPDAMRGRVNAVNFLFIGASNELGEMESGLTAAWFGAVEAVVLGGIGTLLVVGLWLWRFPSLARLDRLEEIEPA